MSKTSGRGSAKSSAKSAGRSAEIEAQASALLALRGQPFTDEAVEQLRAGLCHRSNYIVAKAADVARDLHADALIPEMVAAFDRFFDEPVKTDPQCWAKTALARALAAFDYQEANVFLRGMRHHQMEPVWGGSSDTAGALRAACALALVPCRELSEAELLTHLVDLFSDADKSVRYEAVRAVASVESAAAALLLRLRAVVGKEEPEVMGACFAGVLAIEGRAGNHVANHSVHAWVARFLAAEDERATEAAFALGETRTPEALALLAARLEQERDPSVRATLLMAIALTRQEQAWTLLLERVGSASRDADDAVIALAQSSPSPDLWARITTAVARSGSPEVRATLGRYAPPSR